MFRSSLKARPCLGRLRHTQSAHSARRNFIGQSDASSYEYSQHPVRVISPTIWTVATIGTIYITCAAYDVYQDAKEYGGESRHDLTLDDVEVGRARRRRRARAQNAQLGGGPIVITSPSAMWDNMSGASQVITGLTLTNVAVWGVSRIPAPATQQWWLSLAHTPGYPWFKNRQLFTHMFGHLGVFHLGLNMMGLLNFGPSLAQSRLFNGSGSHFLAFYLSAGIVSSLGAHLSALVFRSHRFTPGMGASGAILGVFSAWAMTHENAYVRVFPFPKVFAAREMLEWEAAFEVLGLFGLWKALRLPINFGHASHLGGLGVGVAYVTYGGNVQIWTSSRRAAFRSMKALSIL